MKKIFLTFFLLVLFSVGLLFYFHNRFWWPPDNGFFAHIAERAADGEVLNKDIQQIHPGYVHFVNAFALKLFGRDFVSLRYPLAAIFFIQICLVFWLLAGENLAIAVVSSLATTILGLLHFLNPDHHWYALFLTVVLCWVISSWPRTHNTFFIGGLLVATIYLFRQLTGIFVGIGLLSYFLISESEREAKAVKAMAVRFFVGLLLLGLIFYEVKASNWIGWLLFGQWPIIMLLQIGMQISLSHGRFRTILARFGIGIVVGLIPIAIYHLGHGSLFNWGIETLGRPFFMAEKEYLAWKSYGNFIIASWQSLCGVQNMAAIFNGLYWLILFFMPAVNGILCLAYLEKVSSSGHFSCQVYLSFYGCFYGLVSLHYQIPVYLYFSVGFITMGSLMWLLIRECPRKVRMITLCLTVFIYAMSLRYQAAQPLRRPFQDFFNGKTVNFVYAGEELPRTHLWIDPYDLDAFKRLLKVIETEAKENDSIFAFPYNPEIYFMSKRKNIMSFALTDHGVQNAQDLQAVIKRLEDAPPALVIYSVFEKRRDAFTFQLRDYVREHYNLIAQINFWEIYKKEIVKTKNQ